jgi:hypothetical protein
MNDGVFARIHTPLIGDVAPVHQDGDVELNPQWPDGEPLND